jgi:hypothetical protein
LLKSGPHSLSILSRPAKALFLPHPYLKISVQEIR